MASHGEELFKRPLYVYNIPYHVLKALTLTDVTAAESVAQEEPLPAPSDRSASDVVAGSQSCSLCSVDFSSILDQRSHLKADLHQYNLKQKLRGLKPVSEPEFEKLIGDLDESLSGSDSDESDDNGHGMRPESNLTALLKKQARLADHKEDNSAVEQPSGNGTAEGRTRARAPLVWFSSPILPEKTYFGFYRALITADEQRQPDLVRVLQDKQLAPLAAASLTKGATLPPPVCKEPHIFLCMIGGGHFAAMVVSLAPRATQGPTAMNREATVLAHKTFHRYTTRRKQGGSQSANDNAKGNAHSAGSSLRRYNEQALVNEVRDLLRDWKVLLDTSELLFVRATGLTNRRTLFGSYEGQVLQHNDIRLRVFPFSTRRATQKELMRAFIELTRLKTREIDPAKEIKKPQPASAPRNPPTPKPAKPKLSEEEETALLHTSQLQAFIRRSKLPALLGYLDKNALGPDFEFQPPDQHHRTPRPLHMAAAQNSAPLVLGILTRGGADPGLKTVEGRTAFELAGDRSTRDAFRVARSELGESKWAWEAAGVPAAMTRAEAEHRDEREKHEAEKKEWERRRTEEERLRAEEPREPENAPNKPKGKTLAAVLAMTPQERREEETRGLTPEMSKRLERERRARAAEERMRKMAGR